MRLKNTLVVFLFCSCSALAQTPDQTLPAVVAAHGAVASTIQTIKITGHRTIQGRTESVLISANVTDGEVRTDYGDPVRISEVVPGVKAGIPPFEVVNGQRRNKQAFVGLFGQLDVLSVLGVLQFTVPAAQVANLGAASVNGRNVTKLAARSGRQQTHYFRPLPDAADIQIDSATGLVASISRKLSAEQNLDHTFVRTFIFSDYRNVRGLLLPFQIDTQMDGSPIETLIVDSVELNPALTFDLFKN